MSVVRPVPLCHSVCLALILLLAAGCASPARKGSVPPGGEVNLAQAICGLDSSINRDEAAQCAKLALETSIELALEYRAVSPALLQNVLVNSQLRPRGLCFQWADDLDAALAKPGFKTLRIRRAVAFLGKSREHSALVVTALNQPFDQGILLDAWRRSGNLFWCPLRDDNHPWIEVELSPAGTP